MDRFEEDLYSVGPLQIFKLLIMLFVISHWLSCSWYYFGDDEEGLALDREGNVIQGWAKKRFTGLSEADDYTKYIVASYWSMMTLSTIGYGDVRGSTSAERAFACFAMVVGAFVFSIILGSVNQVIRNSNPGDTVKNEFMGRVHAYLVEMEVSQSLSKRVRSFFRQKYESQSAIDSSLLFETLSPHLRKSMGATTSINFCRGSAFDVQSHTEVITPGCLHRVPFFEDLNWWEVIKVAQALTFNHCPIAMRLEDGCVNPNDYIMAEGAIEYTMHIVLDGTLVVEKAKKEIGRLRRYDFCGELAVLLYEEGLKQIAGFKGLRRTRSAYPFTAVDLAYLTVDSLAKLRRESTAIDAALTDFITDLLARSPHLLEREEPPAPLRLQEMHSLFQSLLSKGQDRLDKSGIAALLTKLRSIGLLPKHEEGGVEPYEANWEEFMRDFLPLESPRSPKAVTNATDHTAKEVRSVETRLDRLEDMLERIVYLSDMKRRR